MKRPSYPAFDSYDYVYADSGEITFPYAIARNSCVICGGRFVDLHHQKQARLVLGLSVCTGCGWWHLHQDFQSTTLATSEELPDTTAIGQHADLVARWWELHHAALKRIDLAAEDLSIEELRAHLARYWDQHIDLSAQQAEDLVASVLREHCGGDVVKITANANAADGGIDLVLISDNGEVRRAVQVKRRLTRAVEGVQESQLRRRNAATRRKAWAVRHHREPLLAAGAGSSNKSKSEQCAVEPRVDRWRAPIRVA